MTRGIIISVTILLSLTVLSCGLSFLIKKLYSKSKDTDKSIISDLVEIFDIKEGETFVDLGAGDFRVPFAVAQRFNLKTHGYEISPLQILKAKILKILHFRDKGNTLIETKSLFLADISSTDVFYLNLDDEILLKAFAKLEAEAKDTARAYVYNQKIDLHDPTETHELKNGIFLYEYDISKLK